ncbi:MAG: hypothetical protein ACNS60_08985 [Candidatus Cyclobacteriaceae bacterium M2_1C_046]
MLNDKDIDQIGKRLYDLETDPPMDGWKKINRDLHPSDDVAGGFFNKHGWKGLLVLLPIVFYLLWTTQKTIPATEQNLTEVQQVIKYNTINEKNVTPPLAKETELVNQVVTTVSENLQLKKYASVEDHGPNNSQISQTGYTSETRAKTINDKPAGSLVMDTSENEDLNYPLMIGEKNIITAVIDSTVFDAPSILIATIETDSILLNLNQDEEKHNQKQPWNIYVSFTPQYIFKSSKPVTDDEIYVTEIYNNESSRPQQVGFNITAGVSKEVIKDVLIEGNLSVYKSENNTSYSYINGSLDTLIKSYRAEGIIEATPVYNIYEGEFTYKSTFSSLRIGASWFLFDNGKRKFNLSGYGSANFMLSHEFQEKINGQWIVREDPEINKTNFSFIVGAGYNVNIGSEFKFMIMPTFTYNFNLMEGQQPVYMRQHAYGIQLRLTKSLRAN